MTTEQLKKANDLSMQIRDIKKNIQDLGECKGHFHNLEIRGPYNNGYVTHFVKEEVFNDTANPIGVLTKAYLNTLISTYEEKLRELQSEFDKI